MMLKNGEILSGTHYGWYSYEVKKSFPVFQGRHEEYIGGARAN